MQTTFGFVLTYAAALSMIAAPAATLLSACSVQDRAVVRTLVDATVPGLCPVLVGLLGGSGLVCPDLQRALNGMLANSPVALTPVLRTDAATPACTPLRLAEVAPGRDQREYVCIERFGGRASAETSVWNALNTGHAR